MNASEAHELGSRWCEYGIVTKAGTLKFRGTPVGAEVRLVDPSSNWLAVVVYKRMPTVERDRIVKSGFSALSFSDNHQAAELAHAWLAGYFGIAPNFSAYGSSPPTDAAARFFP